MNDSFKAIKVGDEVTITATGPDAHEQENFRGKKLTIKFTIHVCERINAATKDELVEQYSLGTQEVLREQIVMALEQRRDEEQASIMRRQGLEKITEAVDFELPERASGIQMQRELDRMRHEMASSGDLTPDEVEIKLAEAREDTEAGMQLRMKSYFILQRLAMHMETQVHESEINARIAAMAMQRGLRPDHVRSELAKAGQLPVIGSQVRDDKAADAMVAQMSIKDIPAKEWGDMIKTNEGGTKKKASTKKTTTKKASTKKASTKKTSTKKASTKKASTKKTASKKKTT
jgi:FKBP-type peptidyl-prolyl cis-trans isomerase (trigger factor)